MIPAKILIAAGGTGGHIYPGLAIADAIKDLAPSYQIDFVGTPHGLENKIVPAKGYRVHHLSIGRLNSNVPRRERIMTVLKLPWALAQSAFLLKRERPNLVLGVGGHASGPLLLMAALLRIPNAIWEPNAMPGMTNRWLSRFVDQCWVVFDEAKAYLRSKNLLKAGMPVRREIEDLGMKTLAEGGPTNTPQFRILVTGGSQGARGINSAVCEMLKSADPEWLKSIRVVHQTGAADYARMLKSYGDALPRLPVDVREYLDDMADQYFNADLVVGRSGTGTLSELAACGKATILVPFPYASDDHQRKNAESLVSKKAALMILQKDLSAHRLQEAIQELQREREKRRQMAANIRTFHQPRAAQVLAQKFIERIESHALG